MRIGFDAKRYYHNRTGLGNYSRTIVGGLQELFPENDYILYDEKSISRTFFLGRKAGAERCDIYHGLSNELPLDIKSASVKSVVTIHDTAWRTYPEMYHWIDSQLYDLKYGWAARHADLVIAISESTKRDVMRFYGTPENRIKVLYQPVAPIFYTFSTKCEEDAMKASVPHCSSSPISSPYLLSVGSINSRKNLLGTLKAYAGIPPENRPHLVIVGIGREYERECRSFVTEHSLENDVVWMGSVNSTEELCKLYAGAMAMLYPSHYEGFGLPVVEALLSGCPVLTSNVSSLPEAAGPGALLVNPDDIDDIRYAMQRLIDDSALRDKLAVDGRMYCLRNFDSVTLSDRLMNLYSQL